MSVRVFTAGHVDDGKSTLIGRLLYDSKALYEDHVSTLEKGGFDFSLLTDGLLAEREQGITIDVAYRYFSIGDKQFILADAPGHEQYTANTAAAASDADALLLLISAERSLTLQAKRHSLIASLLGVKRVVVAVNKLDLFPDAKERFFKAQKEYEDFATDLKFAAIEVLPISALKGNNVVSTGFPWYQGKSLFDSLKNIPLEKKEIGPWRLSVQTVLCSPECRFYAGTLKGGSLKVGDEIVCFPSEKKTRIKAILHSGQKKDQAIDGEAIALQFSEEIDASRGSLFAPVGDLPTISQEMEALVFWMDRSFLKKGASYVLMHSTQAVPAEIEDIFYTLNVETLEKKEVSELSFNDIGRCLLHLQRPIFADLYAKSRTNGAFLLIDPISHRTVAAGLIEVLKPLVDEKKKLGEIVWITGLPCSGKTTLGGALVERLKERGKRAYLLDGDALRKGLNFDLGFSKEEREESVRRAAEVASLFAEEGFIVVVALISPFISGRSYARSRAPGLFIEVYLSTRLSVCEKRDVKGHYWAAQQGIRKEFTGISSPYEPPLEADLVLDTEILSVEGCLNQLLKRLHVF